MEVLLGTILLSFSTVILGIRYDFRVLLFCFSAKYMDWRITSSSIFLLSIIRFLWGNSEAAQVNLIVSLMLAIALPMIVELIRDRINDLAQLLILVTVALIPTIVFTNHQIADKWLVLSISIILSALNYAAIFVLHYFISDLHVLIDSASTDHLTNLKNVRLFNSDLVEMERKKSPVTVAVIDIDHFKNYNDNYGHDSGDAVLRQMAALFNERAIPHTTFYRIGGEEFGVILSHFSPSAAEAFLHELQETVSRRSFTVRGENPVSITLSVGVAHSEKGETLKKTLKRADIALYQAKESGRNKVMVSA
ncbi:GGDEF domain-containing protein [Trichococcus patagoniensis]|nr:GGDEF domain-containing protein [Trichococcus patagoniensis]